MVATRRLNELGSDIRDRVRWPAPPLTVAVSGGADSATLAALAAETGELRGCVHVHHGFPGSDLLADAALEIAAKIGTPIDVVNVVVPDGPSPEAQAREARYQALNDAADPKASLLLGHTRNDQAETVLLNLIRGAGVSGLAGIPYHRPPNIYRPLLDITRTETREFATLAGLRFRDDPTNADPAIRRNLIRLEILPRLEEINPNIVDTLARSAEHLQQDAAHLDSLAAILPVLTAQNTAEVPIGLLVGLHPAIKMRLLKGQIGGLRDSPGLTTAELRRIDEVIAGTSNAAELEGGIRFVREGPMLKASRSERS